VPARSLAAKSSIATLTGALVAASERYARTPQSPGRCSSAVSSVMVYVQPSGSVPVQARSPSVVGFVPTTRPSTRKPASGSAPGASTSPPRRVSTPATTRLASMNTAPPGEIFAFSR
jgi:hypothetical protein